MRVSKKPSIQDATKTSSSLALRSVRCILFSSIDRGVLNRRTGATKPYSCGEAGTCDRRGCFHRIANCGAMSSVVVRRQPRRRSVRWIPGCSQLCGVATLGSETRRKRGDNNRPLNNIADCGVSASSQVAEAVSAR